MRVFFTYESLFHRPDERYHYNKIQKTVQIFYHNLSIAEVKS